jgi:putative endonuclease
MEAYFVYILLCRDGTYYTGVTNDLIRRVAMHNAGTGAKYTRGRGPVTPVYARACASRADALKEEARIKKLTREEKRRLIAGEAPK